MKKSSQPIGLRVFYLVVILVVTAVAIAGLIVAGSPSQERARRADDQRIQDLQQISYAVDTFWTQNARLPETLEELRNARDVYISSIQDPESGMPYEFRQLTSDQYELCATFGTASEDTTSGKPLEPGNTFWQHGAGYGCFTVDVRKPVQTTTPAPAVMR